MILRVNTAPGDLVTLAEVKAQTRVDASDSDTLLSDYITAASEAIDGPYGEAGRAFATQSWDYVMSGFLNRFLVPVPGATGVSAISYFDADDAEQSLTAATYFRVIERDDGLLLEVKDNVQLPQTYSRTDAVTVTVDAGGTVPQRIKQAALLTVATWYAEREMGDIPTGAHNLIGLERKGWIAA